MKIGILTQPLHTNYGGLLQALALQEVLSQQGHQVEIINREYPRAQKPLIKTLRENSRKILDKCVFNYKITSFIHNNYHLSKKIYSSAEFIRYVKNAGLDVIIVGSDQVWRPKYSPNIYNYYLDIADGLPINRISYAASFGVDDWEYSDEETRKCSKLAKQFDAISVREKSGVQLCKEYLGVNASWVLDPTLLLGRDFYMALAERYHEKKSKGNMFCYILDNEENKQHLVYNIATELGLDPFTITDIHNKRFRPSVTKWIRGFMDAEMVVTDSFHGTVFSIIFNKPFWVFGNERRGMSRFESLLDIFDLKQRLIKGSKYTNFNQPINWADVNKKLSEMRKTSMMFLLKALK